MSDHLTTTSSERGFACTPPIPGEAGGAVSVYESSATDGPHVWLRVTSTSIHDAPAYVVLTAENAWRLADQLRALVRNHYQGDATPDWARDDDTGD